MNDESSVAFSRPAGRLQPFQYADCPPLAMACEPGEATAGLAVVIGGNVRKRRKQHGLSLENLARRAGVSRAMLSQIELGRSTPTIAVLWKIAHALQTPISALLSQRQEESVWRLPVASAKRLFSKDGSSCARALFPLDQPRPVGFYELRLKRRGEEAAQPHPLGTLENLVVNRGKIEILIADHSYELTAGDAIQFVADVAHTYRNIGSTEAVLYLVISYAQTLS